MDVRGKVAVVTGSSRGIGAGLARFFQRSGMKLGLCARSIESDLEPLPAEGSVLRSRVDVSDGAAVEAFAEEVEAALGPIDLWVNNAGRLDPIGMVRDLDGAALLAHLQTNLIGVFNGCRAFLKRRRADGRPGTLINVGSGASSSAYEGWGAYCASKAGVAHLTRVLALEEQDGPLRIHCLAPGIIATEMQQLIREQRVEDFPMVEKFRELHASGDLLDPEAPAPLILRLAFEEPRPAQEAVLDARDLD